MKHRNLRCISVRVGTGCIGTGSILVPVLGTQPYTHTPQQHCSPSTSVTTHTHLNSTLSPPLYLHISNHTHTSTALFPLHISNQTHTHLNSTVPPPHQVWRGKSAVEVCV